MSTEITESLKLSVVVPVYNSQETLRKLIEELASTLRGIEYEVVLVNDGSQDQSLSICCEIASENQRVLLVNLARNFGQHNAIMAGLKHARGDWIVLIDDDLQHPPGEIPKLLQEASKGYDVVYGKYKQKRHKAFRNLGSRLNDYMATLLIRKPRHLYFSSFKLLRSYIVREIIRYDAAYPYLDGLIFRTTQNIGSVEVEHHERTLGKSNYTFGKLLLLWANMFTNFSILPLRIATCMGLTMAGISFLMGIGAVILKLTVNAMPNGWASLIVALVWLSGVQLACVGLLGEYVGRIYLSSNRTPQYVIKEVWGKGHGAALYPSDSGTSSAGCPSIPVAAGPCPEPFDPR